MAKLLALAPCRSSAAMASPSLANSSPDRKRSRLVSLLRRTPLAGLSARIPRPTAQASMPARTTVARHAVPEPLRLMR